MARAKPSALNHATRVKPTFYAGNFSNYFNRVSVTIGLLLNSYSFLNISIYTEIQFNANTEIQLNTNTEKIWITKITILKASLIP